MYCGECGTKNKGNAKFCENCGKPLEGTKAENKAKKNTNGKKVVAEKKPMDKKTKIGLIVGGIVVAIILVFIFVGKTVTDPKKVALDYFEAITSYDAEKMYSYLDVKESEFANKKIFKKKLDQELKDTKRNKVTNYKVVETTKSDSGLITYVKINYTTEGSTVDKTETIELTKSKKKALLFFDQWNVATTGVETIDQFELKVMKDSKVTLEGIKVDKKYLDKEKSTETEDVYILPSLFPLNYEMKVELPYGFTLEDTLNVNSYRKSQTVEIDEDSIPEKEKKKIAEKAKEDMLAIYNAAIAGKTFDEIKSTYEYKDADLDELKEAYEELKEDLANSSGTLKKIEYKDVEVRTVDFEDGSLEIYLYTKYNYTVSYESGGESKEKTKNSSDAVYLTYDYVENAYRLVEFDSLQSYFSKY